MSAHIESNATISAIVGYARSHRMSIRCPDAWPEAVKWIAICDLDASKIGQILLNENFLSVNYRYSEQGTPPKFKFKLMLTACVGFETSEGRGYDYTKPIKRVLKPIDIIKLCRCLSYQSCEHPGWEASWANYFLEAVISAAIHELPGYDGAPWGLHDDVKVKTS